VRVEVAAFREGFAAAGVGTDVGPFAGVGPSMDLEGAGAHEAGAALGTEVRSIKRVKCKDLPVIVVTSRVVLEVAMGCKAASTPRKLAAVGLLASVDAHVRFQVASLSEGLATALIRAGKWLFPRLRELARLVMHVFLCALASDPFVRTASHTVHRRISSSFRSASAPLSLAPKSLSAAPPSLGSVPAPDLSPAPALSPSNFLLPLVPALLHSRCPAASLSPSPASYRKKPDWMSGWSWLDRPVRRNSCLSSSVLIRTIAKRLSDFYLTCILALRVILGRL
jgi:hypothetical protein